MNSKQNQKKPEKIEHQKVIGFINHQKNRAFTDKDNIIYNLSIGFTQDPLRQEDFKYTSDVDQDFCTFPTSAAVIHHVDFISPLMKHPNIPKFPIHALLHAEQRIQLIKEKIQIGVDYYHECKIVDCVDKGANAILWYEVNSYQIADGKRQLAFVNQVGIFLRGLGGFGFKGKNLTKSLPSVPQRKADYSKNVQTYPGQAFLYRLNIDRNPLHIDPKVSSAAKFDRPIIHGLCSYGSVARVFVQEILGNDPTRLRVYHTRFIGHVYPGQSLTLNVWNNGQNQYIFEAVTNQRKTKALVGTFSTRPQAKL